MKRCTNCHAELAHPVGPECTECGALTAADRAGTGARSSSPPGRQAERSASEEADLTVCHSCGNVVPGGDENDTCVVCGEDLQIREAEDPLSGVGVLTNQTMRTFLLSGLVAAGITLIMSLFLRGVLSPGTWFHAVLFPEGAMLAIPWLILLLLLWGSCYLGLRAWFVRREGLMMSSDLAEDIVEMVANGREESIRSALKTLRGLPEEGLGVFLSRTRTALEEWDRGADTSQIRQSVLDEEYIDGDALEGSLNIIRVFIWAAPIIGFIGTVLGISLSIAEFSTMIGGTAGGMQMAEIQQGLVTVTAGLAYAFNTTLVGLVVALLLMIPTTYVQRLEDEFLASIHRRISEDILPALGSPAVAIPHRSGPDASGIDEAANAISQAAGAMESMEASLHKHSRALSGQVEALRAIDESMSVLESAHGSAQEQQRQMLAALNTIANRLNTLSNTMSQWPTASNALEERIAEVLETRREDQQAQDRREQERQDQTLAALRAIENSVVRLSEPISQWPDAPERIEQHIAGIAEVREEDRGTEAKRRVQEEMILVTLQDIRDSVQGSRDLLRAAQDAMRDLPGSDEIRETRDALLDAMSDFAANFGGPFELHLTPGAGSGDSRSDVAT